MMLRARRTIRRVLLLKTTRCCIVALIAVMTALAWQWNWLKHTSPSAARLISITALILLVIPLL